MTSPLVLVERRKPGRFKLKPSLIGNRASSAYPALGALLYSNDFAALGAGWTGDWTVSGGLLVPGTGFMTRDLGAGKADCVGVCKITALPTSLAEVGMVVRRSGTATGINGGHRWTVDNGGVLRLYPDAGQTFVRNKGSGIIVPGSEVRLYAKGTTVDLWVDGVLIHHETGVANDYGTIVGFGNNGNAARFDDMAVYVHP